MQSLQNICLDSIILSNDPDVIKSVIDLPSYILKMIDRRDGEICCTRNYKRRFYSLTQQIDTDEEEELSDDYTDEEDSGKDEAWFDPNDFDEEYFY